MKRFVILALVFALTVGVAVSDVFAAKQSRRQSQSQAQQSSQSGECNQQGDGTQNASQKQSQTSSQSRSQSGSCYQKERPDEDWVEFMYRWFFGWSD